VPPSSHQSDYVGRQETEFSVGNKEKDRLIPWLPPVGVSFGSPKLMLIKDVGDARLCKNVDGFEKGRVMLNRAETGRSCSVVGW
jgi:hypothetical protein